MSARGGIVLALMLLTAGLAGCLGSEPTEPAASEAAGTESAGVGGTAHGAAGFSNTSVFPGDYGAKGMPRPVEAGPYEPLGNEIVDVASELDGATIHMGIVRPDVPAGMRVPVIVVASPYFYPMVETEEEDQELSERVDEELAWFDDWFVPHGYAVVAVTVRGTTGSGGCFEYMGPQEQADVDQAVTWLGSQEWSNGHVGMIGLSYAGSTPWMVAALGNPHLKTIVPISGVNDAFDLHFRNGTPQERALWHPGFYWGSSGLGTSAQAGSAEGFADNAACTEGATATAAAAQAFHTGERNAYYDARNYRPGVEENYNGSVFLVQGLQDWNVVPGHQYPWVNQLEERGVVFKHMLGQWPHEYPHTADAHARLDFAEILLHWWDYWLKDDTTRDLGPRVQVQDDVGRWRDETSWPPRDANRTRLHLTGDGLATEPTSTEEPVVVAASPAHFAVLPGPENLGLHESCAACVVLHSEQMETETLVSGFVRMQVDVTPLGSGGYVNAYLYADDGSDARRIAWGSVDLRFAHGGVQPQPVTPGARMPLSLQMEPLESALTAGERLVLVVAQGSYGSAEEARRVSTWELSPAATQPLQMHLGGEDAWLELPVIERTNGTYFEAP